MYITEYNENLEIKTTHGPDQIAGLNYVMAAELWNIGLLSFVFRFQ